MEKTLFEKYANLVRKRAHEYSEKFNVDYDELESQGFLIYCECLETYDVSKSNFCTYLYIQLNRLGDYVKTYLRQQGVLIQDYYSNKADFDIENNYEEMLPARENSVQLNDFLREAKQALSEEAYNVIAWIIGRSWEGRYKRKPTATIAAKHFNSPKQAMEKLWEECRSFWNSKGFAMYA